ncbi:MAG: hypothetical protein A2504_00035 [Bdellovibrionales bacterium RIFOXYD12_FULL_39_22]|nr:MAG: hypothetical protein A2385_14990 [Bdellovibrionales bacterium RIFOXYB1_FULL_39_21]OFZ43745.1 MAG: hypothetical protein A2485_07815 [Bdellovibrionales bacterium RIFOXYC12_FULL_39_17]OFZ48084.1 MAG: hypothetical protein A2404_15675 [Bdellovibrionales bacterium RIFOXYC1_FULL_39_130]OFZ73780.1 MAG: hypothetical protein A2451_13610 [Bdellovibrionales bacterium RIFOXYC2_FULL_39_8]OFZ77253.1 MAG: hypothetical protein A2560_08310 [Bdellovibrionales bacterium RIFOXYD1_FULL_39_84]OFZ95687.1 MAG:
MSLLCTLKNIHLTFASKKIFDGANFNISTGDRIGLIGLNGKGKTSLLKILTDNLRPDHSTPPFQFDKTKSSDNQNENFSTFLVPQELPLDEGENYTVKNYIFRFYPKLQLIHQELEVINRSIEQSSGLQQETLVNQQIKLMEQIEQQGGWDLLSSYESYLKYFGLQDLNTEIEALSGGEQKKVLLSLGLTAPASIILWDEPTNHLDLEAILRFEEMLNSSDKAFVLVTHDRHLLGKVTNKIFHINKELINTFSGSYLDFLHFLAEEEQSLVAHMNKLENSMRRETAWMRQGIKARGTRSKKRVEGYNNLRDKIKAIKENAQRQLGLNIVASQRKTKILAQLVDVAFSFEDRQLFSNINLSTQKGDKIGLLGANGVGKTTLINLITKKLSPSTGSIKMAEGITIQHFTQKREAIDPNKTPAEILGNGSDFVTLPDGRRQHISAYFESYLFSKAELNRPISTFSGGEKNRLQMALNFLRPADLWIFDEPTNDLDLATLQILENNLTKFEGSLILVSHDRSFLANVTNKIWLLRDKKIELFTGGYEQAEEYLDALTLEDIIQHDEEEGQEQTGEKNSPLQTDALTPLKLSGKQKARLNALPTLIKQAESDLTNINSEIDLFDFLSMNQQKQKEFFQLEQKRNELEEMLLSLYEEQEELLAIAN